MAPTQTITCLIWFLSVVVDVAPTLDETEILPTYSPPPKRHMDGNIFAAGARFTRKLTSKKRWPSTPVAPVQRSELTIVPSTAHLLDSLQL